MLYSTPIEVQHGVTQGDTNSIIYLNIVIDAVLRSWFDNISAYQGSGASFYADDGSILHENPTNLQKDIEIITDLFNRVGLEANALKTNYMVIRGSEAPKTLPK